MKRWGEGDLEVPDHLIGLRFSDWPTEDEDAQDLLLDAEEDEHGKFFRGAVLLPNCDNAIFCKSKFYTEPLGGFSDPTFREVLRLYRMVGDGAMDWSWKDTYTSVAIDGVIHFKETLLSCRAAWATKASNANNKKRKP